jgi:hypothetical protein
MAGANIPVTAKFDDVLELAFGYFEETERLMILAKKIPDRVSLIHETLFYYINLLNHILILLILLVHQCNPIFS